MILAKKQQENTQKRVDFQRACSGAYNVARKNGWIKDYDWFCVSKTVIKWTYETCKEEAQKYKSKVEFQKGSSQAYQVARKNDWLKEYNWLVRPVVHNKKWVYETCKEEAKKYKSRTEFGKKCVGAYSAAIKNGWIDEYDWFVEFKKPSGYWDYNTCKEEAKKYNTRIDFFKGCARAYEVARDNDWLKEYNWLVRPVVHNKKWTYETCKEEAQKYKSKVEFQKGSSQAYQVARKNDWLKEYNWLVRPVVHNKKWTYETCKEEAQKYKSRGEFQKGSNGAYSVARQNKWLDEYDWFDEIDNTYKHKNGHCIYVYLWEDPKVAYVGLTHLKKQRHRVHVMKEESPVFRYSKDNSLLIPDPIYLVDKLTFEEAQNKEEYYIEQYRKQGYYLLNTNPAGSIGAYGKGKWTYDSCKEEARKYKSRGEFCIKSPSAYRVARINGWLGEYEWFKEFKRPSGYWTYETCKEEAKKYKSRSEFGKKNGSAYEVARTNGWLEEYDWFAVLSGKWTYETCMEEAKKYKTKKEFRENCVSAYDIAFKNGWINEYSWLEQMKKPKGFWTYKTCKEEAKKYRNRSEFAEKCCSAYLKAHREGWINDYDWFEESKTGKKWTYKTCKEEALKYKSKGDFNKGCGSAYNVALKNGWLNDYSWFVKKKKKQH